MTPERTGGKKGGNFRFDREFADVGRIHCSSGTDRLSEFKKRDAILTKLYENAQLDVLRAFMRGELSIEQLVAADRSGKLASAELLSELKLQQNLWTAIDDALPRMGKGEETRRRYETSLRKLQLQTDELLSAAARVAELQGLDWRAIEASWGGSPADWNHLRRALSAFLTVHLDDVHHPFRRATLKKITLRSEKARIPDLPVETFWAIVEATPAHARPCYVSLAATGMRLGEYLGCSAQNLVPSLHAIDVPGTKTEESAARIYVDPELWSWIEQGIPSPLQENWMRIYWRRACLAVGAAERVGTGEFRTVRLKRATSGPYRTGETPQFREVEVTRYKGPTLHDLRHLYAQLADEEGATDTQVMGALRHSNPAQTREYKRRRAAGEVARMVGNQLLRRIS
jgi:integrase